MSINFSTLSKLFLGSNVTANPVMNSPVFPLDKKHRIPTILNVNI